MEYKKIKDLVEINSESITKNYNETIINYLDTSNITNGKIECVVEINIEDAPSRAKRIVRKNDIVYSMVRPNLCHYGILREPSKNMIVSTGFAVLRCKEEILPEYLYAYITLPTITMRLQAIAETSTSTYPSIRPKDLEELDILLPPIRIQQKIASILSNIDKKIQLNNEINDNLLEIGKQVYKEKAKQESDMVELKTFFEVKTGKKDANASTENGVYPFFTCSKQILKIADYSFDGPAILVAGNGDFNVKVFDGKFDAYQRTYVLMPNNKQYLGYLYFAISENLNSLTAGFRGSVIKFITKGMIENYEIPHIHDAKIYSFLNKVVEKIQSNNNEIERLSKLRDTVLPKLMNGEIELDKIEI